MQIMLEHCSPNLRVKSTRLAHGANESSSRSPPSSRRSLSERRLRGGNWDATSSDGGSERTLDGLPQGRIHSLDEGCLRVTANNHMNALPEMPRSTLSSTRSPTCLPRTRWSAASRRRRRGRGCRRRGGRACRSPSKSAGRGSRGTPLLRGRLKERKGHGFGYLIRLSYDVLR